MDKRKKIIIALLLIITLQLVNYIIFQNYKGSIVINTSASWSINLPAWLFFCLTLLAFTLIFYLAHLCNPPWPYSLVILVAAGLSNLLDRFFYGGVVDYIDIKIWPVFNLADIIICGATVVFIWHFLFRQRPACNKH